MERTTPGSGTSGSVFVLGGNSTTLACASSLRADKKQISISLIPLAWTPVGMVVGDVRQQVGVAPDNIAGWLDQTFPPDDEHAFLSPVRDIELLVRTGWQAQAPETLTAEHLLNPEDIPDEVLEGLSHPPVSLAQCAVCRRACVRDAFAWNDRQLCAWDYHATVLGRRGPWREAPYEDRLFETLPRAAYVAGPLLDEIAVDIVLVVRDFPEEAARQLINAAISHMPGRSHLSVRTDDALILLRERA